jgi:hypothetical protein
MRVDNAEASVIDACITSIDQYLFDSEIRKHVIDKNFELGKKYYSQETSKNLLKEIFQ